MWTAAFIALKLLLAPHPSQPGSYAQTIAQVAASGRCVTVAQSPDGRVVPPKEIPPGKPPLLSFRLYESKARHSGASSGLMLDDAGH